MEKESTIFINVPSFQDDEYIPTIRDAFEKASNPRRVFIGTRYLTTHKDEPTDIMEKIQQLEYPNNVKINFQLVNEGNMYTVFSSAGGRAESAKHYNDEDYVLSIDSHAIFAQDWDSKLIDLHNKALIETNNDKTIVTAYAAPYYFNDEGKRDWWGNHMYQYIGFHDFGEGIIEAENFWIERPIFSVCLPWICQRDFEIDEHPDIIPSTKFAYNFSFSNQMFIYDEDYEVVLMEEDMIKTFKLIKDGWTFAYPSVEPIIGHLYTNQIDTQRGLGERAQVDVLAGRGHDAYRKVKEVKNFLRYYYNPEYQEAIKKYEEWLGVDFTKIETFAREVPESYI